MKNRIPPVWIEGPTSRQAHCDLPAGTYEREIGREGFFGPAARSTIPIRQQGGLHSKDRLNPGLMT